MNKEKMQDIKERLDLFPSNMNEIAQKAYCELFEYIENLEKQNKKQKEVIDKVNQCIKDFLCSEEYININGIAIANNYKNILDILKEVLE